MKVEIWEKEGAVLLTRNGGESLKISLPEFWEIVKAGDRLDVKQEIDNYLDDNGEVAGVTSERLKENEAFLDEVVDRVIESRLGNENGDQVYEAICYCVKYGKNKEGLFKEKSLQDMEVEDFKDPERRREFNGLQHAQRDLKRRMHEQNGMPFGGDRHMQDHLKLRLGDVTAQMDLLRVKEWLSHQPDDLNTGSSQYLESLEMMEEICRWSFPELAGMVFDGEDKDLLFREPHDCGLYVWAYYNPDANTGGQIVENSFGPGDAARIADAALPAEVFDANHVHHSDINRKEFFMTLFDMLKMKENGHYLGDDEIGVACRRIADVKQQIFDSFQDGRSTYELGGWDRGSVVVYCDCDLFTDKKVHFVTEESNFFYDMEQSGQGPAHRHIAEKLTEYVMAGELQLCEGTIRRDLDVTVWHGDVVVPYGFPVLEKIENCDSMELAAPEMLRQLLKDGTGFRNVSVEEVGYYNKGIGYSFSFETNLTADKAGGLVQKALEGLRFEACSDLQKPSRIEGLIDDAKARSGQATLCVAGTRDLGPGARGCMDK